MPQNENNELKIPSQEDPWVMYIVIRESLGMSPGKACAQSGHAVGMIYEKLNDLKKELKECNLQLDRSSRTIFDLGAGCLPKEAIEGIKLKINEISNQINMFENWRNQNYRKVVLRASDKEWEHIKAEVEYFLVKDAGYTQVPAGSETAIGFWPQKKSQAPKIIKKLQVLK